MKVAERVQNTINHPDGSGHELRCYASGNGSLSFAWVFNDVADGTPVEEEHVLAFLELPYNRERFCKWMVAKINGNWCLFAVWIRYSQDENPKAKGHLRRLYSESEQSHHAGQSAIEIRYEKTDYKLFPDEWLHNNTKCEFHLQTHGWLELKNSSVQSSLLFWLNNEDQINKTDTAYIVNDTYQELKAGDRIEPTDEVRNFGWKLVDSKLVGTSVELNGQFRRRNKKHVSKPKHD